MVLVHGAGMDRTVWQFQTRALAAAGHDVYAVDLPGHGLSEGPAPTTIGGYADWLVAFLEVAGLDRAIVVGHSMGALVALDVAGRWPDRISALVLVGVAARMPVHPELLAAAEGNDHLAFELIAAWSHTPAAKLGHHPTPGLWMVGATIRLLERSGPGVLHGDLAACDRYADAVARAGAVAAPTLLLLGAEDLMTRPKAAEPLAAALPDARIEILPGTGHLPMIERPDEVVDAVVGFAREVAVPTRGASI